MIFMLYFVKKSKTIFGIKISEHLCGMLKYLRLKNNKKEKNIFCDMKDIRTENNSKIHISFFIFFSCVQ